MFDEGFGVFVFVYQTELFVIVDGIAQRLLGQLVADAEVVGVEDFKHEVVVAGGPVVGLEDFDRLFAVVHHPFAGLLVGARQLLDGDGVLVVKVERNGVDAAGFFLEVLVEGERADYAQRAVVEELLRKLVAEQRRRDFAVLHCEDGGSGLDHLPFDLHRVDVVLVEEAHRYVVVGVAYSVRYRDVLAFEVLRALNRRVGEDVERFASRVYAGRELHAHAVDGGDEHRSDVVARYVYLARAYRVGLRAAAARHADDLRLEPFGLIEALHLGDSEGAEAEAAVVADDYLLAVCGLLLPCLVLGGVSRRPRRLSSRRYQAAEHRAQKLSLHCASSPSIGIYKRLYGFSPQPDVSVYSASSSARPKSSISRTCLRYSMNLLLVRLRGYSSSIFRSSRTRPGRGAIMTTRVPM